MRHSADVICESYAARRVDVNGTICSMKKNLNANLCSLNWWQYKNPKVPKLLLSGDGNFIASQVHPEIYIVKKEELKKLGIIQ